MNREPETEADMIEFQVAVKKLLTYFEHKIDYMEGTIINYVFKRRNGRRHQEMNLKLVDGRPQQVKTSIGKFFETLSTEADERSIVDPNQKLMIKLSASIDNNQFNKAKSARNMTRIDPFSAKNEMEHIVQKIKSPRAELDELTGINNFDKKLQKLSALTHQKGKFCGLNGQSFKFLSQNLEGKL